MFVVQDKGIVDTGEGLGHVIEVYIKGSKTKLGWVEVIGDRSGRRYELVPVANRMGDAMLGRMTPTEKKTLGELYPKDKAITLAKKLLTEKAYTPRKPLAPTVRRDLLGKTLLTSSGYQRYRFSCQTGLRGGPN